MNYIIKTINKKVDIRFLLPKVILLSLALVLVTLYSFGQQASMELPAYHPVSPNAASLGNYGLYPVNKNLGKASIGIPIYTVSEKGISIPIGLNYNSSGIRLNDLASWVGLGWTLNAGGAIIRNTKGLPDINYNSNIPDIKNLPYNSTNYAYLKDAAEGLKDTAPDQYVFNALGINGTFYFDQNNGFKAVFEDESMVIKINAISSTEIHAILQDGTKLIFGKNTNGDKATEYTDSYLSPYLFQYVTTWYLAEVISADGKNTVSLKYKQKGTGKIQEYARAASETLVLPDNLIPKVSNYQNSLIERLFLEKIEFRNGFVKFESTLGRQDLENDYKLDAVKIYATDVNPVGILKDEYHFEYDYFIRSGGSFSQNYSTTSSYDSQVKSLKLISMYRGGSSINDPKHTFEYNSTTLKRRCTTAQDFWGYCNNNTGSLLPSTYVVVPSNWSGLGQTPTFTVGDGVRTVNESNMKAGILEKITYPTKGYSIFDYEANSDGVTLVGGLRIKSISNYDGESVIPTNVKNYTYSNPNLLHPNRNKGYIRKYYNNSGTGSVTHAVVSTSPHYNNNLGGEPVIEYGIVTEYDYDPVNLENKGKTVSYFQNITNNKVMNGLVTPVSYRHAEYSETFDYGDPPADQLVYWSFLNGIIHYGIEEMNFYETSSWKRGKLIREEVYKSVESGYTMIKMVENTYETILGNVIYNNFVYSPFMIQAQGSMGGDPYDQNNDWLSLMYNYQIDSTQLGRKILKQTTSTIYDTNGANPVVTTSNYYYDNTTHKQLTRTVTTDSKGETIISKTIYPDDVPTRTSLIGGDLTVVEFLALDELKEDKQHRISVPIQTELYKDFDNDDITDYEELVSLQRTTFKNWDGFGYILPEKVASLNGPESVVNTLRDRIIYYHYDNSGNPVDISKPNDFRVGYIWSYNNSLPIAKIDNAIHNNTGITAAYESWVDPSMGVSPAMGTTTGTLLTNLVVASNHTATIGINAFTDLAQTTGLDTDIILTVKDSQGNTVSSQTFRSVNGSLDSTVPLTAGVYSITYSKESDVGFGGHFNYKKLFDPVYSRVNEVLFENFEEHVQRVSSATAHTGKYIYQGTYDVELRDKLEGDYTLTYWSSSNGTDWTKNTVPITVTTSSTTYSITGSNYLDDIRLHPVDAQMTTYTHDPLIGITSQTDPNGVTTYYEYDDFGRLRHIRDFEGNVLSKTEYHYKAQN
ncbi:RHS repeat domain-containing protein [Reichenbachiella sp. MALMAid0571]|uniref:RHS repeat domain-containing protein n=1 Tax=Reichenbachiella sp. MALMAid0571 TaxID=3143939 RepID=UPI0032DF73E8